MWTCTVGAIWICFLLATDLLRWLGRPVMADGGISCAFTCTAACQERAPGMDHGFELAWLSGQQTAPQ